MISLPASVDWKNHYLEFFGNSHNDSLIFSNQNSNIGKFNSIKEQLDFQQYQKKYNPFYENYSNSNQVFSEFPKVKSSAPQKITSFNDDQKKKQKEKKKQEKEELLQIAHLLQKQTIFPTKAAASESVIIVTFKGQTLQLNIPEEKQFEIRDLKNKILQEFKFDETEFSYQLLSNDEILGESTIFDSEAMKELQLAVMHKSRQPCVPNAKQFCCSKGEFETSPSLQELYKLPACELKSIPNFKIFNEFGEISFQVPVDLTEMDLSQCIKISQNCIEAYSSESFKKPPVGSGLNVLAVLTYYNVKIPEDLDSNVFIRRIKRMSKRNSAELISFNQEAGIIVIKTQHF